MRYYTNTKNMERAVSKLMYDYEMAMKNKKTPVVSTKVKKATLKKEPSLKSKSIETNKVKKVIN